VRNARSLKKRQLSQTDPRDAQHAKINTVSIYSKQVCVQLPAYAENVALPAFSAARRAAARAAAAPAVQQSIDIS